MNDSNQNVSRDCSCIFSKALKSNKWFYILTVLVTLVILLTTVIVGKMYVDNQVENTNKIELSLMQEVKPYQDKEIFEKVESFYNKQFTNLLTILSIIFAIGAIGIPFIAYFFQRQSLKEERIRIKKETQEDINKAVKDARKNIKDEIDRTNYSDRLGGLLYNLQVTLTSRGMVDTDKNVRMTIDFLNNSNFKKKLFKKINYEYIKKFTRLLLSQNITLFDDLFLNMGMINNYDSISAIDSNLQNIEGRINRFGYIIDSLKNFKNNVADYNIEDCDDTIHSMINKIIARCEKVKEPAEIMIPSLQEKRKEYEEL